MQLHDPQGQRLYLTADERRAFMAAAAKAAVPVRTFWGYGKDPCEILIHRRCA